MAARAPTTSFARLKRRRRGRSGFPQDFPNRRSESVSNPYFSGDRRVNWSQLEVATVPHNRLGGGSRPAGPIAKSPANPTKRSIAGGADEPRSFPYQI